MSLEKRAIVTGASGFVGSHLLRHLHDGGWQVGTISRPAASEKLSENLAVSRAYSYSGRTAEISSAMIDFHPRIVFHLGSLIVARHQLEDVEPLIAANVLFGTQVLEGMKAAGVTALVNAGTARQNFSGSDYDPVDLYAATKQALEDILLCYSRTAGLRAITLRLFQNYGPREERRRLVRMLLDCLRTGEPLAMSPGDQIIDLTHVDDICRAFLHAGQMVLAQQEPGASVYAVSGGERRSVREVAATLEEAAGQKLPVEFGARPHREREVMVPWDGPTLPGWQPQVTLIDGFRRLLAEERLRQQW